MASAVRPLCLLALLFSLVVAQSDGPAGGAGAPASAEELNKAEEQVEEDMSLQKIAKKQEEVSSPTKLALTTAELEKMRQVCKLATNSMKAEARKERTEGTWGSDKNLANQSRICEDTVRALGLHVKEQAASEEVKQLEKELGRLEADASTSEANAGDEAVSEKREEKVEAKKKEEKEEETKETAEVDNLKALAP
jgi:hypothetical protein